MNERIYHRNVEYVCRGRWLQICACATSGMCRSSNNNRMSNLVYLPFCAKIAAIPQAEKLQLLCKWKDHPERTFFLKLDKFLPLKAGMSLSFSGQLLPNFKLHSMCSWRSYLLATMLQFEVQLDWSFSTPGRLDKLLVVVGGCDGCLSSS